jgi:enoyl-CoA hydratase
MGLFLVLSGDYRVGAEGAFRLVANEVAIGLALPDAAIELLRQRLTPAYFTRAALLAEPFSPDVAVEAGALDRVVPPADLPGAARAVAEAATTLDPDAHAATKARVRRHTLDVIRASLDADLVQLSAG